MSQTKPDGALSQWDPLEAAVEVLNNTLGGLVVGASTAAADPGEDATQAFAVQGVTDGTPVEVSAATLTAMAAAIGSPSDNAGDPTMIGLLKQIVVNTTT